jgi:hypothetical protein
MKFYNIILTIDIYNNNYNYVKFINKIINIILAKNYYVRKGVELINNIYYNNNTFKFLISYFCENKFKLLNEIKFLLFSNNISMKLISNSDSFIIGNFLIEPNIL